MTDIIDVVDNSTLLSAGWPGSLSIQTPINGGFPLATTFEMLGQAIRHLCGHAHNYPVIATRSGPSARYAGVSPSVILTPSDTWDIPLTTVPFCRHLEVWIKAAAANTGLDNKRDIDVSTDVSGSSARGVDMALSEYTGTVDGFDDPDWIGPFIISDVGDGSPSAGAQIILTVTNSTVAANHDVELWAVQIYGLPTTELTQGS